ncbi:MAG: hypothetical protein K2L12_08260 [Clostridia bacterium]|nr:hypothetical protein [Clostridia bacterium]
MELTTKQKRQRILLEIKDILQGAAFPIMLQLVLSASVILFADYSLEIGIQVFALVFGEILLIGSYILFGRQNGVTAYRRTIQGESKRKINVDDITVYYRTGEYALWKGIVIGAVSVIPFMLFEFIQCLAPNIVCEFIVKYAFGWASYPFIVIGQIPSVGKLSEWLNFIWIVVPVGVHLGAYIWGGYGEKKRQLMVKEAQELKGKRKK